MEMEKEMLLILNQINDKLDAQSRKLDEHSEILKEHSQMLINHSETLKEHSLLLGALRNGQEVLKAEISEIRLQNAKDFGDIRNHLKDTEISMTLLKEDSWKNRKDIARL